MSKRTASEVEEDTVANVAEVVWGLLTGTQGSQNPDATAAFYSVNGMNEFEKVDYYATLRRVDRAAAQRFASLHGIISVKVEASNTHSDRPAKKSRKMFITQKLWDSALTASFVPGARAIREELYSRISPGREYNFIRVINGHKSYGWVPVPGNSL
jgi:hypothetical protein